MKAFLASYQKQLEVAFLLGLIFSIDLAHIQDAELRYVLMGLIGTLTGFRGSAAAFGGLKSLISGNASAPAAPVNIAVTGNASTPVAPTFPVNPQP